MTINKIYTNYQSPQYGPRMTVDPKDPQAVGDQVTRILSRLNESNSRIKNLREKIKDNNAFYDTSNSGLKWGFRIKLFFSNWWANRKVEQLIKQEKRTQTKELQYICEIASFFKGGVVDMRALDELQGLLYT